MKNHQGHQPTEKVDTTNPPKGEMPKKDFIGAFVKVNYDFPLTNEIFEIISERKTTVEVQGDFSAGTHPVTQSEWIEKSMIKEFVEQPKRFYCSDWMEKRCVLQCALCKEDEEAAAEIQSKP